MRTALLALTLLLIPTVVAHGAPPPREIDIRAIADGDELYDYGLLGEEAGAEVNSEGAHDLLVLDMRTQYEPAAAAMVLEFRMVAQGGDPSRGNLSEVISFKVGETEWSFTLDFDGTDYTSSDFPFAATLEVGDDHVAGAQAWIPLADLGVTPGDELTDLRVAGYIDDRIADVMPGSYHLAGVPVDDTVEDRATYTVAAPATTFTVTWDTDEWAAIGPDQTTADIRVASTLATLTQIVAIDIEAAPRLTASASASTVKLAPGDERRITATLTEGANRTETEVRWALLSDFGDRQVFAIDVPLPPAPDPPPPNTSGPAEAEPTPAPLLAPWALAAVVAMRRCRNG